MKSVLSHIVGKHYSNDYENIATEALAYILQSSEKAREAIMKILRAISPELPNLRFETQKTEEQMRPDMQGVEKGRPRVFIENKFWAGLTENQPIRYLETLAKHYRNGVLLMVAPASRQESIWREVGKRLEENNIPFLLEDHTSNIYQLIQTEPGPFLALISWDKLLLTIEAELADELQARNDLSQLKALCNAAQSDAFIPLSSTELTNQRFPALIGQLNSVVESAVELGISEGFINIKGYMPNASWERIGRYMSFPRAGGVGAWLGIHFYLWKKHGGSPLWMLFYKTDWGRGYEVRDVLEVWAERQGYYTATEDSYFVINIDLLTGEELDGVVRTVVKKLKAISDKLSVLKGREEVPK